MTEAFTFNVATYGTTTAIIYRARDPIEATFIFAHGAGAPQKHPFMPDMAKRLAQRGVDVVTFNFLYAEHGRKLPDRNEVLEATWQAAIASTRARGGLPTARLFCGGKSMGGRIASQVASSGEGLSLTGLVFFGYPLHPPKKPKIRRDRHLPKVPFPMLFVQGTRDELGTAKEIRTLGRLVPLQLHVVEGGDHSLALSKREGPEKQIQALDAAADAVAQFVRTTHSEPQEL